jgi:hypothetical protein
MEIKDGGPAFPMPADRDPVTGQGLRQEWDGMTLRDWFAGQALSEVYDHLKHSRPKDVAELCFDIADAMLAAREDKP